MLAIDTCCLNAGTASKSEQLFNETTEEIESVANAEVFRFLKPSYAALSWVVYLRGKKYQFHCGRIYLDGDYPSLVLQSGKPITLLHLITHTSGLPFVINYDLSYQNKYNLCLIKT